MAEQIPMEAMTQRQRDIYYGEWKDLSEEQKQFAKDFADEEQLEAVWNMVSEIMATHTQTGTLSKAEVIVSHPDYFHATRLVASAIGLGHYNDESCKQDGKPAIYVTKRSEVMKLLESLARQEVQRVKRISGIILPRDYRKSK